MSDKKSNLTIVSACFYDDETPAFRLIESCKHFGLNLSLYGIKEFGNNWRNMKVVKLLEHLETITTEYMLYTDAGDSWMYADEKLILRGFNRYHKCDILIGGERSMYPVFDCDYPKASASDFGFGPNNLHTDLKPTTMRFACAGGFMGKTTKVKKALKRLLELSPDENDQLLWHLLFLSKEMRVKIDYSSTVFLNMANVELCEIYQFIPIKRVIKENILKAQTNGPFLGQHKFENISCIIHFNGGKGGSQNELNMIAAWDEWKSLQQNINEIIQ